MWRRFSVTFQRGFRHVLQRSRPCCGDRDKRNCGNSRRSKRERRPSWLSVTNHCALTVLRKIRRHVGFPELPIIMYSQSGLLTIGDLGFQEIERLDAGWLLKDRYDSRTEEVLVCGELMRARMAARRSDRPSARDHG